MMQAGHRGASGTEPENTLRAFRQALAMGAHAVELDVQHCKSGELVVIHDDTVDRTSNGTGRVKDLTLAELKALDFGKGEQISTLGEVFDALKGGCRDGSNPHIFVELKSSKGKEAAPVIHEAVSKGDYSYDDISVIGFNHPQIFKFKRNNPDIDTGLSFSGKRRGESAIMIPLAKRMGVDAINPEKGMITPELVEKAHNAGLKVNTWTVNEHKDIKRVTEAGVDCIMSDHPDRVKLISQAVRAPATQERAM